RTMIGSLILKEIFNLTDVETVDRLEFDLRWQVALGLTTDAHCCQKTLHNFRTKLMKSKKARILFEEVTGKILAQLKLSADRQRLDSTHICSNIARLTRL